MKSYSNVACVAVSSNSEAASERDQQEAYEKTLSAILAINPDEVIVRTFDITSAVATILGAYPEIVRYRDLIKKMAPDFDTSVCDNLEDYVLAASHANAAYLAASDTPEGLVALAEEAYALREMLSADIGALVRRNLINSTALKNYTGQIGYKNVADDLFILVAVSDEAWSRIQGVTAITREDIDRARKLGTHILRHVGLRDQSPGSKEEKADIRARAITLVYRAYDQIRRAIGFIRWDQGDLESIAPSLYAQRRNRSGSEVTEPEPAPAETVVPATTPANSPTTTPAATAPALDGAVKPAEPGANPFVG